ncbi:MAG TPA: DUF378 domain-containing protein [Opitutales bacterium]|nr:DUF378 domain-containing protein [Opitutales bacterium]
MKILHIVSTILVVIGALNWGLIGALDKNVVGMIFGDMTAITRVIYILVGLAGIYEALVHLGICKHCCHKDSSCSK